MTFSCNKHKERREKELEILHGIKIKDNAEFIWGWATEAGKLRADRRANLLTNACSLINQGRVLEIGCGTGEFSCRISGRGLNKIIGLDISLDLIRKAKDKTRDSPVVFIIADVESLPFKNNIFDAVIGVSILHHLKVDIAIREIRRILNKGGILVFSEQNMLNQQVMVLKNVSFIKDRAGDVKSESAFFRWSISCLLRKSGFMNISVTPFDFLHPATPKKLINFIKNLG